MITQQQRTKIQRSDSFLVGALLALTGGFLDAYSYLTRGGVFANAQTGNMVLLGLRLSEQRWGKAFTTCFRSSRLRRACCSRNG